MKKIVICIDKESIPDEIEMKYDGDTNSAKFDKEVYNEILKNIKFTVDLTR